MDNVHVCKPVEMVFVDPARLFQLARERGIPQAEFIAGVAMEEIAERLRAAEAAYGAGELVRLGKISRMIVGLSGEMGLETLSKVALKLAEVSDQQDPAALAALVMRLSRVGENSLAAVGDLGHLRL